MTEKSDGNFTIIWRKMTLETYIDSDKKNYGTDNYNYK